jgi:hypothetical protein
MQWLDKAPMTEQPANRKMIKNGQTALPNPLLEQFGPPPFRFKLRASTAAKGAITVRAYALAFRCLAVGLTFACIGWLLVLWWQGQLAWSQTSGLLWLLCACALMLYTAWHIWTSRTTLSSDELEQTWIWNKKLELRELASVKLIRIPGLDWLIAPRLYARTLLGKFAVFYAADKPLLLEFERLGRELKAFRRQ